MSILVRYNLNWNRYVNKICSSANYWCKVLNKCFTFKSLTVIKRLYLSIIRPKLEYAVTVWNPTSLTCINQLEKIQRRSTKFGSLAKLPYPVRLKALELSTFKTWRDRGDLIQLFRYFKGFDNINLSNAGKFSNVITRG